MVSMAKSAFQNRTTANRTAMTTTRIAAPWLRMRNITSPSTNERPIGAGGRWSASSVRTFSTGGAPELAVVIMWHPILLYLLREKALTRCMSRQFLDALARPVAWSLFQLHGLLRQGNKIRQTGLLGGNPQTNSKNDRVVQSSIAVQKTANDSNRLEQPPRALRLLGR